jgi:hypothetical protein
MVSQTAHYSPKPASGLELFFVCEGGFEQGKWRRLKVHESQSSVGNWMTQTDLFRIFDSNRPSFIHRMKMSSGSISPLHPSTIVAFAWQM